MIMISAGRKWAGLLAICIIFVEKKLSEKAFFFKSEMEISTFQDAGHNLNGVLDMAYSKFGSNYEHELCDRCKM